jgi:hypothetical protein
MAIVTEKDGTETVGGIVAIRTAFVEAGGGKLVCLDCTLGYDHSQAPNGQLLTFSGYWSGDQTKPFRITAYVPPNEAAASHARAAARELIQKGHTG